MNHLTKTLLQWYHANKRNLPWRETRDPYKIWLSEIILQQTRVEQGMKYYLNFLEHFPDIHHLAEADEQTVLKLWQGLGYYNRARNLHTTARYVVNELEGTFPGSYEDLIKLKGIGAYTGAAIASFAHNEPVAAVDGNVARVIARLFGIHDPINSTAGNKKLKTKAQELIPEKNAGDFNQAMIEFGAVFCTPKNPDCAHCPLKESCSAYQTGQVERLPVKNRQIKQRNRFFNYLYITYGETVFLKKRTKNDIWRNLYEFPLIETASNSGVEEVMQSEEWEKLLADFDLELLSVSAQIKHQLSHQKLFCRIFRIHLNSSLPEKCYLKQHYLQIHVSEFEQYPVPRLISRLLEEDKQTGLPL